MMQSWISILLLTRRRKAGMRKATITCYNYFTHKIHLSKCFNLKINIKHFHLSHIQNIVDLEKILEC